MTAADFEARAEQFRQNTTATLVSNEPGGKRYMWLFYGIVAVSGVFLYKGYRVLREKREEVRKS